MAIKRCQWTVLAPNRCRASDIDKIYNSAALQFADWGRYVDKKHISGRQADGARAQFNSFGTAENGSSKALFQ